MFVISATCFGSTNRLGHYFTISETRRKEEVNFQYALSTLTFMGPCIVRIF